MDFLSFESHSDATTVGHHEQMTGFSVVFDFDQSSENMFSIGEDGYISHRPTNDMVAEINYSKHDIDYDFTEEVYFQLSTLYEEKIVQNIMIASYCQKNMDREFYLDTDKLNYFYACISGVKSK